MSSRIVFSVAMVIMAFCVILGSCSRYLPTKRSPSPPTLQDYDQDLYSHGGADSTFNLPGADFDPVYSISGRPKLSDVVTVPVLRRPRNQPEAYYSRW
ncbi:hypothetical protein BV898_07131 [Hypsibius exemplaris]|uniref:Uncharacterized protein n=1 Tax=Hypsibius exemplaris TaxID=2072580 RepID=A0A1W0WUJ2_HYPEX|nr:hypothetical protein BV898_07131 [Hypsibius exemplaris]